MVTKIRMGVSFSSPRGIHRVNLFYFLFLFLTLS